jgi:hypothetical protein
MWGTIVSALGGHIFDSFFANARGILKDFQDRKITEAELFEKLRAALLQSFADVEKAHADLIAKTFESFQQTLRTSPMMQVAWCWVVYTQLAVLLWHQAGIPAFVKITGSGYPSSGSTVEWAYALLGFMFGAGAMLLRTGPGASGGLLDNLKKAIGK